MSSANSLWGAPRIHGELLKLGIQLSQATVAKYVERRRKPPSQTLRTFLDSHLRQWVSTGFLVGADGELSNPLLCATNCNPLKYKYPREAIARMPFAILTHVLRPKDRASMTSVP
jgi:hypothetical protein